MIAGIFAVDINNGIAKDGTLPWPRSKKDFAWFRFHTLNQIVVMGSKTWLDPAFPKPLKKRKNIILSKNSDPSFDAADLVVNAPNIKKYLNSLNKEIPADAPQNIFVIGGKEILEKCAGAFDSIYLTVFQHNYECDLAINVDKMTKGMELISYSPLLSDGDINMIFKVYQKIK